MILAFSQYKRKGTITIFLRVWVLGGVSSGSTIGGVCGALCCQYKRSGLRRVGGVEGDDTPLLSLTDVDLGELPVVGELFAVQWNACAGVGR